MELWEFNSYIKGYQEILKQKEKEIIKQAYYTAAFVTSKKTKKLSYYLNTIDKIGSKPKTINKEKLEFARKMYEKTKEL